MAYTNKQQSRVVTSCNQTLDSKATHLIRDENLHHKHLTESSLKLKKSSNYKQMLGLTTSLTNPRQQFLLKKADTETKI